MNDPPSSDAAFALAHERLAQEDAETMKRLNRACRVPDPDEEVLCPCGCGQEVVQQGKNGRPRIYATPQCRDRFLRNRRKVSVG